MREWTLKISYGLIVMDTLLLMFLGKAYTKYLLFSFWGYAHELVLLTATLLCFINFNWKKNRILSIEALSIISVLYLIYSAVRIDFNLLGHGYHIIRQFAVFMYMICLYVIVKKLYHYKKGKQYFIKVLKWFSICCFVIQGIHILNLAINTNLLEITERNAYSPILIMGFLSLTSYVLTETFKSPIIKTVLIVAIFSLSISFGHDSVYLAILVMLIVYWFIVANKRIRIGLICLFLMLIVLVMIYVPSFTDVNMQWRLIYWKDVTITITENFLVLGEGFGIPYLSAETTEQLNQLMLQNGVINETTAEERYLTAPHNSFLSMMLHLGVLSLIVLAYPFRKIQLNQLQLNKNALFLILSLVGMSVFSFFNVILELPHSSSVYWVVYFMSIFLIKEKIED